MSNQQPFQERRTQQDRRGADRLGKYDRRKNRCGNCGLFKLPPDRSVEEGFCQYFERPIGPDAYACPYFESA